jgi:hypothetical protein
MRTMDWLRIAAPLVALGAVFLHGGRTTSAALLVYEPFDYDDGTVLHDTSANGENLVGDYESTNPSIPDQFQLTVESPGLTYGALTGAPGVTGNRLSQPSGTTSNGATVSVADDVLVAPGQAIYWSALFTFDDSQNGNHLANVTFTNDENGDELSFGEVAVGVRAIRVGADTAATGMLVAAGEDAAFVSGQTLLLVGRYVNSAAAGGDRLDLIGYDPAEAIMLPASFDPGDPNAQFAYELSGLDINFEKITAITFQIRANNNNFIDELRIGQTYADVIPEPATTILVLIGTWACVGWSRRP